MNTFDPNTQQVQRTHNPLQNRGVGAQQGQQQTQGSKQLTQNSQIQGRGVPQPPQPVPTQVQPQSGGVGGTQQNQGKAGGSKFDFNTIKTPTGKTIKDFRVPQTLIQKDPELVDYILRSESMKDEERQYWFNLTEIMNTAQVEKLRDILSRERKKLAEIDAKYGKKKIDPIEAAKKAKAMAQKRSAQHQALKAKEDAHNANKEAEEDAILAELDDIE